VLKEFLDHGPGRLTRDEPERASAAAAAELHQRIQPAGKQILINLFSLMKTGELHDLNNDAYQRPTEKLDRGARDASSSSNGRPSPSSSTRASHRSTAMRSGSTRPRRRTRRSSSSGSPAGRPAASSSRRVPTDDEIRRFFFHFARFRAPAET
jgi:hypothetical protein